MCDWDDPDLEAYGDRAFGRGCRHRAGVHDLRSGGHVYRAALEDYLFLRTGNGYPCNALSHDAALSRLTLPVSGWAGVVQYAAQRGIALPPM